MTAPVRRPSLRDVAERAGVSVQTVSRVARDEPTVRPPTALRVRAAMSELGYVPNPAARALRNGRSSTVGVVGRYFARTGEAHIVQAVVSALRREGYGALLVDVDSGPPLDLSRALADLAGRSDGLVLVRLETADPGSVTLPDRVPLVLSDSRVSQGHTTVGTDHAGGARAAVDHLLELGHRTVHHLAGPADSVQAQLREAAWERALRDAGRPVPQPVRGDWTPAGGHQAAQDLLRDPDLTAVFCANDEMALGLLLACHQHGVRVPEELSVVGFDDVASGWFTPPLTTVAQDFTANGEELVAALLGELRDPLAPRPDLVLVPARLMVRESTAAPRLPL